MEKDWVSHGGPIIPETVLWESRAVAVPSWLNILGVMVGGVGDEWGVTEEPNRNSHVHVTCADGFIRRPYSDNAGIHHQVAS